MLDSADLEGVVVDLLLVIIAQLGVLRYLIVYYPRKACLVLCSTFYQGTFMGTRFDI